MRDFLDRQTKIREAKIAAEYASVAFALGLLWGVALAMHWMR